MLNGKSHLYFGKEIGSKVHTKKVIFDFPNNFFKMYIIYIYIYLYTYIPI